MQGFREQVEVRDVRSNLCDLASSIACKYIHCRQYPGAHYRMARLHPGYGFRVVLLQRILLHGVSTSPLGEFR